MHPLEKFGAGRGAAEERRAEGAELGPGVRFFAFLAGFQRILGRHVAQVQAAPEEEFMIFIMQQCTTLLISLACPINTKKSIGIGRVFSSLI